MPTILSIFSSTSFDGIRPGKKECKCMVSTVTRIDQLAAHIYSWHRSTAESTQEQARHDINLLRPATGQRPVSDHGEIKTRKWKLAFGDYNELTGETETSGGVV